MQRGPEVAAGGTDLQTVDVESLELERPRTVGVEHVGLWAMERLGLGRLLEGLGFNGRQRAVAVGSIIGRMGQPGSERASWRWLCERSGLGELLDDFEAMSLMRLYRVSDALMAHREAIEKHLFEQVTELFGLGHTVTLYDLTNTFFEGEAADQPKAQRGHSKEKRSDCALLTLGLVLDGSGFVRRSEVFAGRVDEDKTLEPMLKALNAPADALVVMDAGIATEDNVAWLRDNGYVIWWSAANAPAASTPSGPSPSRPGRTTRFTCTRWWMRTDEVRLYCYSEERAKKEEGIARRFAERFESELRKLHEGRRGPAPARGSTLSGSGSGGSGSAAAAPGSITPWTSSPTRTAQGSGRHLEAQGRHHAHPSRCLLSTPNVHDWDPQTLWRTYTMLTDLEAVFRSLKSELGLRPIFHKTQNRSDGHLFITVIAYQLVQPSADASPNMERTPVGPLCVVSSGQHRFTASFRRKDGRTLHVRKATRAEQPQLKIYTALDLHPAVGSPN